MSRRARRAAPPRLLKQREGAAVEGRVIAPRVDEITVAELAEDLKTEYRANGRKSLDRVEDAIAHLLPVFGRLPALKVTSADARAYQAQRQAECAALKRLFSLAVKGEKIHRAPLIGMLQEHNIRTEFFVDHQYEAMRAHLPACVQPVVTFAFIAGWRAPWP